MTAAVICMFGHFGTWSPRNVLREKEPSAEEARKSEIPEKRAEGLTRPVISLLIRALAPYAEARNAVVEVLRSVTGNEEDDALCVT